MVFSGFEIGISMEYPAQSIEQDYSYVAHHPLAEAYCLFNPPPHNRPTWDLTSVLYAVRPDAGYFELSPPGRVTVADDGSTLFTPAANGPHRYLMATPEQCASAPGVRGIGEPAAAGSRKSMKSIQFRWVAVTVAASIALGVGATLVAAETPASRQFATLLDDVWEFDLKDDPLGATDVGDHRYDNLLPTISLADSKQRIEVKKAFVKRLEAIDRDQLSAADQVNYDIFGRGLRNDIRQFDFQTYLMPVSDRWGFHIEFPELPRNLKFETDKDYENYIARLRGFDAYAAGYMELMREGVRQGVTVPAVIMQRYNEPIQAQIVDDPEASLMFEPFKKFPDSVAAADQERLRTAGRAAIAESDRADVPAVSEIHARRICAELPSDDCGLGVAGRARVLPVLRPQIHHRRRPDAGGSARDRPARGEADSRRDGRDHQARRSSRATSRRSPSICGPIRSFMPRRRRRFRRRRRSS